jgi:DNA primase
VPGGSTREARTTAAGIAAEVKNKVSVVDVVGETVQLKKAGSTHKGLCPFHSEKTPSFVVTPARETWHCFGCGLGGDIFSFVMQRDSVSFPEALKVLAARAGIEIDERSRRDDARKARLRDVLETAIAFYHSVLQHRVGQPALDYLRGRGFTDETIERFQLGWAPGGWDALVKTLAARRNIGGDELVVVGLASPRSGGSARGVYDRFRERIMFPIRDMNGNAAGLGGRVLDDADDGRDRGPKYLNSPATPLFDKSRTLYLIDRAKSAIRKEGTAVIVEGYTDALMAHQAGFTDVVASLGTALTPGQVAILSRLARRVALAYDVDPAGQSAGTFGVTELNALIAEIQASDSTLSLSDVGVVRLPEGRDPDEVIRSSPDQWREAVRTPDPILAFLIDNAASRFDVRAPEGRKRVVDMVLPTLRRVRDPILRDAYLQELAKRSGVEERVLLEALHASGGRPGSAGVPVGPGIDAEGAHTGQRLTLEAVRAASDAPSADEVLRAVSPVEAALLRLLLLRPDSQLRVVDELAPDQLPSTVARELYRAIVEMRAPSDAGVPGAWERGRLLDSLDEETRALALALLTLEAPDWSDVPEPRIGKAIEGFIIELEADRLEARLEWNRAEQAEAERVADRETIDRLLREARLIDEQRRSLDRRREQARLHARAIPSTAVVTP